MKTALLFVVIALACHGQASRTVETKGACSPANTGSNNTFKITCQGISVEQGKQFLAILNKIYEDRTPVNDVLKNLEEIKARLNQIGNQPVIQQHSEGPNSPNTVNINQKPPARRIPPEKLPEIEGFLKQHPAKITVAAVMNDGEAYQFAQDWYDVLKVSGWEMHSEHVLTLMPVGMPPRGIMIKIHGIGVGPDEPFAVSRDSPAGALSSSLVALNLFQTMRGQRYLDLPDGELRLEIFAQN